MAGFLPSEDRDVLRAVAALRTCNPFRPERLEREKEALGAHYQSGLREWNLDPSAREPDPNLTRLRELTAGLVERHRAAATSPRHRSGPDAALWREAGVFLLFHDFVPDFDARIAKVEAGHDPGPLRSWERFRATAEPYLTSAAGVPPTPGEVAHFLACCDQVRRAFHHIYRFLVGRSAAATRLRARVWQSIFTHDLGRYQRLLFDRIGDVPTLITGPSGTGKELVARAIALSRYIPFDPSRATFATVYGRTFLPVQLSALSPTLIESELFGHRRGAFTGALADREGYFATCGPWGTVFLDEMGETDPSIQVKLLRVLQTRTFQRLGDTATANFTGKVVAATHRDLPREIEAGRFREDLYYRLCADRLHTPALREILADAPGELTFLVSHIAQRLVGEEEAPALVTDSVQWFEQHLPAGYPWPGNFRELEQAVRNMLVHREYLPDPGLAGLASASPSPTAADPATANFLASAAGGSLPLDAIARAYVRLVRARCESVEATARRLQLDRRTVRKYLAEEDR